MAENYPSNSHKSQEPEKKDRPKVEKVVSGEVSERKDGVGRKIAKSFVGDDAQSVGSYILFDVMIPAAKNMIADMVSQGIQRALFGGTSPAPRQGGARTNYTSYNKVSPNKVSSSRPPSPTLSSRARSTHDFKEVVLQTREEAETVLQGMFDILDDYDFVTVNDFYSLVGITGSFTDDKWGWGDLRGATTRQIREGYLLELPRTIPAD